MTNQSPVTKQDVIDIVDESTKLFLSHVQGMKYDINQRFDSLEKRVASLEHKVDEGFGNAHSERKAMQEDLEATITLAATNRDRLDLLATK